MKINSSPLSQFEITGFYIGNLYVITVIFQLILIICLLYYTYKGINFYKSVVKGYKSVSVKSKNYKANIEYILIPSRFSLLWESIVSSVKKIVYEQMSTLYYIPVLLSLFMIILYANLYGNLPHSYALTASAAVSLGISVFIFISATIIALSLHKLKFISFFIPEGTPASLKPLLFIIELVSYGSRSISLGVRLIANITAGHTLIYTCSGIIINLISTIISNIKLSVLKPLIMLLTLPILIIFFAITGLELAVSFIQAFIFLLLTSSYLKDAIYLH